MKDKKIIKNHSSQMELIIDGKKVTAVFPKENLNGTTMKLIKTILIKSYSNKGNAIENLNES
jgi:hypothetical protein